MPINFTRSNLPSTKCPHGHGRMLACSIVAASGRAQRNPKLLKKCHARLEESRAGRERFGTCHAEADAGRQHAKAASSLSTVCDVVVLLEVMTSIMNDMIVLHCSNVHSEPSCAFQAIIQKLCTSISCGQIAGSNWCVTSRSRGDGRCHLVCTVPAPRGSVCLCWC